MFELLLILNIILVLVSLKFMFKTLFQVFLDIKIFKLVLIIIFYIFSVLLLMMALNSIFLALEYPNVFYERGGSVGSILEIDLFSYLVVAVIYLYKKRVEKVVSNKSKLNLQDKNHIKWNKWYRS